MLTGYSMSALIVSFGIPWGWAFYIHVVMLIPFIVGVYLVDPKLLQIGKKQHTQEEYEIVNIEGDLNYTGANQRVHEQLARAGIDDYEKFNLEKIIAEETRTKNFTFW